MRYVGFVAVFLSSFSFSTPFRADLQKILYSLIPIIIVNTWVFDQSERACLVPSIKQLDYELEISIAW